MVLSASGRKKMPLSNFNRTKQAGDIVNEVGVEVGLPRITDPFTSTDPQYLRLITLLNISGNNLIDMYPWTRFNLAYTLSTQVDVSGYPLPEDFNCMIPQTLWQPNMTFQPGYGSISPQMWTYLSAVPLVGTINVVFRERLGGISIIPTPQSVFNITFEYQSRGWCNDTVSQVYRDNVTKYSDVVLLDPALISRYLKMKFLEAVGFDTQKATDDFNLVLESRSSKSAAPPIMSMSGTGGMQQRLINVLNIPETGFG
jgi:hypothetical protein